MDSGLSIDFETTGRSACTHRQRIPDSTYVSSHESQGALDVACRRTRERFTIAGAADRFGRETKTFKRSAYCEAASSSRATDLSNRPKRLLKIDFIQMGWLLVDTIKEQKLPWKKFIKLAQLVSPYVPPYLLRSNAIVRCQ
jgi:hypothetical protein